MTRSSMTGCLRRLSDNPPKVAMSGGFPSRLIISFKHLRGPSGVWDTALRRLASLVTLVAQFLAVCSRSKWSRHLTKSSPHKV
jgi:hypothetical protein